MPPRKVRFNRDGTVMHRAPEAPVGAPAGQWVRRTCRDCNSAVPLVRLGDEEEPGTGKTIMRHECQMCGRVTRRALRVRAAPEPLSFGGAPREVRDPRAGGKDVLDLLFSSDEPDAPRPTPGKKD